MFPIHQLPLINTGGKEPENVLYTLDFKVPFGHYFVLSDQRYCGLFKFFCYRYRIKGSEILQSSRDVGNSEMLHKCFLSDNISDNILGLKYWIFNTAHTM